jgi:hypothetical protein
MGHSQTWEVSKVTAHYYPSIWQSLYAKNGEVRRFRETNLVLISVIVETPLEVRARELLINLDACNGHLIPSLQELEVLNEELPRRFVDSVKALEAHV